MREQHDQKRIGATIERERAANIGGVRVAPAVAHAGVLHARSGIAARAGERKSERAGHRGFRVAGVGRTMM